MENIKKFNSFKEYEDYKAIDGWTYPSICYIDTPVGRSVRYDNELVMKWYDSDTAKKPYFFGDISYERFKEWVDSASSPCEIKKDGSKFHYLLRSDFNILASNFNGLTSMNQSSHYNTSDKTDFLQMTEIKQVNIGLFKNSTEGSKEVHFNFDLGCPEGYYKWFSHPYWNPDLGCYTKLFGRYDITPITNTTNAPSEGINCCYGDNQGEFSGDWNLSKGSWAVNTIVQGSKVVGCLSITYWEYLVLGYIFCAYYRTFNSQSISLGLSTNFSNNSGTWTNGQTDILGEKPHGKIVQDDTSEPYRFMFLENPLHGKQFIYTSNISNISDKYYLSREDNPTEDLNILGKKVLIKEPSFINTIDLFGIPIEVGGSDSTGFYDKVSGLTNDTTKRSILVGGSAAGSGETTSCGVFNRNFLPLIQPFNKARGRITMNR